MASIGTVSWSTSLFADRRTESFLIAIKADVRRRTGIEAGDTVSLEVALVD
jgi:hypothetical protein